MLTLYFKHSSGHSLAASKHTSMDTSRFFLRPELPSEAAKETSDYKHTKTPHISLTTLFQNVLSDTVWYLNETLLVALSRKMAQCVDGLLVKKRWQCPSAVKYNTSIRFPYISALQTFLSSISTGNCKMYNYSHPKPFKRHTTLELTHP